MNALDKQDKTKTMKTAKKDKKYKGKIQNQLSMHGQRYIYIDYKVLTFHNTEAELYIRIVRDRQTDKKTYRYIFVYSKHSILSTTNL